MLALNWIYSIILMKKTNQPLYGSLGTKSRALGLYPWSRYSPLPIAWPPLLRRWGGTYLSVTQNNHVKKKLYHYTLCTCHHSPNFALSNKLIRVLQPLKHGRNFYENYTFDGKRKLLYRPISLQGLPCSNVLRIVEQWISQTNTEATFLQQFKWRSNVFSCWTVCVQISLYQHT